MSKEILGLVPLSMSLNLASDNFKFAEKAHNAKDFMKQGIKNIIGTSLIKTTGQFIGI